MRATLLLAMSIAVAIPACNAPDFDNAYQPVEVSIRGRVLDAAERARPESQVFFYRHACHPDSTALTPLPSSPVEVITDADGRFHVNIMVDSNRRGRPDACLQVRARLGRRTGDMLLGLLYPDTVAIPLRVTSRSVDVDIRVPLGAPSAVPRYSTRFISIGTSSVEVTTILHNDSAQPIRVLLRSPCTVMHRAYVGTSTEGEPAWDEEWRPGGCKANPWEVQIEARDSIVSRRTITAAEVFGSVYPPGRAPPPQGVLTFEAVVVQLSPDPQVVRLRAGTAVLAQVTVPAIMMEPAHASIAVGDSVRFTAHGISQPMWRSSHPEVAAVGANGMAVARAVGQAVITAIAAADTTRRVTAVLTVK
jgi:hypothetical protein